MHKKIIKPVSKDSKKSDQLFFHDIVNLTHGLILYLDEKINSKNALGSDELILIAQEIKTLQSLAKDHFHFSHKNLIETLEWVPFSVAESALKSLIQTYLPRERVRTYVSVQEQEEAFIYYPLFYRIMNNLIKNMGEANTDEVYFYFSYQDDALFIETKNKTISDSSCRVKALNQKVNDQRFKGLGLESVDTLTHDFGGSFESELVNGFWINRIILPSNLSKTHQIKAA